MGQIIILLIFTIILSVILYFIWGMKALYCVVPIFLILFVIDKYSHYSTPILITIHRMFEEVDACDSGEMNPVTYNTPQEMIEGCVDFQYLKDVENNMLQIYTANRDLRTRLNEKDSIYSIVVDKWLSISSQINFYLKKNKIFLGVPAYDDDEKILKNTDEFTRFTKSDIEDRIVLMDSMYERINFVENDFIAYRGEQYTKNPIVYECGNIIRCAPFTSYSVDLWTAANFSDLSISKISYFIQKTYKVFIICKFGKNYKYLTPHKCFKDKYTENEIIIPRNAEYVVNKVQKINNYTMFVFLTYKGPYSTKLMFGKTKIVGHTLKHNIFNYPNYVDSFISRMCYLDNMINSGKVLLSKYDNAYKDKQKIEVHCLSLISLVGEKEDSFSKIMWGPSDYIVNLTCNNIDISPQTLDCVTGKFTRKMYEVKHIIFHKPITLDVKTGIDGRLYTIDFNRPDYTYSKEKHEKINDFFELITVYATPVKIKKEKKSTKKSPKTT